jgi:NAD(P)-dependent dehydrogenase (short-subunit alcohol dehydrogenase family)
LEAHQGRCFEVLVLPNAISSKSRNRIGFGTAELLLEVGAHVTVISSKQEKVDEAVKRLNSPNAQGRVGNLLDEQQITEALKSLAPVDHVILSSHAGLPKGTLADSVIDEAKKPYGVKFWGSVIIGKGKLASDLLLWPAITLY